MKMKKGLIMVVFLLAISSVMAAMSYSSAKVTSAMTGSVKSTNDSLVSLRTETGTTHEAAVIKDGMLVIDFHNYRGTNKFGMQRDSEYIWNDLFLIKNNSENPVHFTIKTVDEIPNGVKLSVKLDDTGFKEINKLTSVEYKNWIAATEKKVAIKVEIDKTADLKQFTPNIVISGVDAR